MLLNANCKDNKSNLQSTKRITNDVILHRNSVIICKTDSNTLEIIIYLCSGLVIDFIALIIQAHQIKFATCIETQRVSFHWAIGTTITKICHAWGAGGERNGESFKSSIPFGLISN
jgi:hypothetical protein